MREILFRGKRVDNGEWVEGYVVNASWYLDGTQYTVILPTDVTLYPHSEFDSYDVVDPKTVGQFTGLVDKNGKKIFEGDILELEYGVKQMFNIQDGDVRYSRGGFYIGTYGDTLSSFNAVADYTGVMRGIVIGNIHDNPELLIS